MPIDSDNLFLIYCICAFYFNLSSIITPQNVVGLLVLTLKFFTTLK